MKYKIKLIIATLISLMPLNFIRVFLYKYLLNYKIKNSKIGFLTIIAVKSFEAESVSISYFNKFIGDMSIKLEKGVKIAPKNYFYSGKAASFNKIFKQNLIIKKGAWMTSGHFFDVSGEIIIDEGTVIAGIGSQFWTHGSLKKDVNIYIGKNCYIGSGVKFAPGTFVADNSLVAIGSVVGGEFKEKNTLIGGVPAKVIKKEINWKENWV